MSTPIRYFLFQIPGWLVSALLLTFLTEVELLSSRTALLLWVAWIVKDAAMYPLLHRAYESGAGRHGGAALVGSRAIVVRSLGPRGFVRVRGELWRAECPENAPVGAEVEVVSAEAMRLVVRRVRTEAGGP